jgi:DNA-binding transcriptional MerR regulator
LFKNNLFKGELKEEEINLKVETILIDFSLIIPKKESIEMNEFMKQINEENIELKRKIKELEKEKSQKQIEKLKPNIKNKKRQIKKKIIIFLL